MKLYIEAKLVAVGKEVSMDKVTGQPIEWYTNLLKSSEGGILEVNSGISFEACEGETGVCAIEVRKREGAGYKLSLKEFSTGESLDLPTIDAGE